MSSNKRYYIDLLWAFTEKEIKVRYKKTVFGFLWVILNPILQMLVIGLIFSYFVRVPNYFLFLFSGLLPWQFFSLSLNRATASFVNERALLQKASFPKETIPISIILGNFIHLLVSFILFLLFLLVTGRLAFFGLLLLVPGLIWLLALTIGISLFTATLNVRFRDISFFVQTVTLLWFYVTPIIYSLSLIPVNLRPIFILNPLTATFELIHQAVLGQGSVNFQILFVNSVTSIAMMVLGIIVYRKNHDNIVDWL